MISENVKLTIQKNAERISQITDDTIRPLIKTYSSPNFYENIIRASKNKKKEARELIGGPWKIIMLSSKKTDEVALDEELTSAIYEYLLCVKLEKPDEVLAILDKKEVDQDKIQQILNIKTKSDISSIDSVIGAKKLDFSRILSKKIKCGGEYMCLVSCCTGISSYSGFTPIRAKDIIALDNTIIVDIYDTEKQQLIQTYFLYLNPKDGDIYPLRQDVIDLDEKYRFLFIDILEKIFPTYKISRQNTYIRGIMSTIFSFKLVSKENFDARNTTSILRLTRKRTTMVVPPQVCDESGQIKEIDQNIKLEKI